ncbi:MAG: hypothetical protein JSS51_04000 [Planctomycetes bacterium]|nr:hypothetical protein [Planctomycetota bacterium]
MPATFQFDLLTPGKADEWRANLLRFPSLQRKNRSYIKWLADLNASVNFPDEGLAQRLNAAYATLDALYEQERQIARVLVAASDDAVSSGALKPGDAIRAPSGLGELLALLIITAIAAATIVGSIWAGSFYTESNNRSIIALDNNQKQFDLGLLALKADIEAKKKFNAEHPDRVPVGPVIPVSPTNPDFRGSTLDKAINLGGVLAVVAGLYLVGNMFKGKKS